MKLTIYPRKKEQQVVLLPLSLKRSIIHLIVITMIFYSLFKLFC